MYWRSDEQRVAKSSVTSVLEAGDEHRLIAEVTCKVVDIIRPSPDLVHLDQRYDIRRFIRDEICHSLVVVCSLFVRPHVDVPVQKLHDISKTWHRTARGRQ